MKKSVTRSRINGTITAPASKSYMQRIVALSLLTEGTVEILNPDYCSDVKAALSAAQTLGAAVKSDSRSLKITGSFQPAWSGRGDTEGSGGSGSNDSGSDGSSGSGSNDSGSGSFKRSADEAACTRIDCGESGLALRMFSPVASLFEGVFILTGRGSLLSRPVNMITDAMNSLGVKAQSSDGYPPVTLCGPLAGGSAEIDGSVSSQLLTGLLIALPLAENNSLIYVNNLKSTPYIDMTLDLVEKYGGRIINSNYRVFEIKGMQKYTPPRRIEAEGDWSGAAFLLAAAALAGSVRVNNLCKDSRQADRAVLDALLQTGASVTSGDDYIEVTGRDVLYPFEFDAVDCPDLFPPLVALASGCSGISRIHGVERLKHKESDRENALISEFSRGGIKIESDGRTMEITGGEIKPFSGHSHNDHRIAMALAAAAVRLKENGSISIENSEAVSKSYPGFFNDFAEIGGKVYE